MQRVSDLTDLLCFPDVTSGFTPAYKTGGLYIQTHSYAGCFSPSSPLSNSSPPSQRINTTTHTTMRLPVLGLALCSFLAGQSMAMPAARNNGKAVGHHKAGDPTTYSACQMPKAQGEQLQGCPEGTLYVSQTDPQAGYGSVRFSFLAVLPDCWKADVIFLCYRRFKARSPACECTSAYHHIHV